MKHLDPEWNEADREKGLFLVPSGSQWRMAVRALEVHGPWMPGCAPPCSPAPASDQATSHGASALKADWESTIPPGDPMLVARALIAT